MPIYELCKFVGEGITEPVDSVEMTKLVGTEFDTVNDKLFVWKYVIPTKTSGGINGSSKEKKKFLISWMINFTFILMLNSCRKYSQSSTN